jgi:hypothetical protein
VHARESAVFTLTSGDARVGALLLPPLTAVSGLLPLPLTERGDDVGSSLEYLLAHAAIVGGQGFSHEHLDARVEAVLVSRRPAGIEGRQARLQGKHSCAGGGAAGWERDPSALLLCEREEGPRVRRAGVRVPTRRTARWADSSPCFSASAMSASISPNLLEAHARVWDLSVESASVAAVEAADVAARASAFAEEMSFFVSALEAARFLFSSSTAAVSAMNAGSAGSE